MSTDGLDIWFTAIGKGDVQKVNELIDTYSGTVTGNGETGLMVAVRAGNLDCVKLLAGVESGRLSPEGYTALSLAAAANSALACEALACFEAEHKLPRGSNALIVAAKHGALASIRVLTKHIDPSSADVDGLTALDYAVQRNYSKCALALLSTNRFTVAEIEKSLLSASAGEYSETIRIITNALRLKYSKRQKDDELVEISGKFIDQAAVLARLQTENASLKATVDWFKLQRPDISANTSATLDAPSLNTTVTELKHCILKQSNKICVLEARIAQMREGLLVISPELDDYELDMSAVRLREAEIRRLKASLSKPADNPTEVKNSSLLDNLADYYIDDFNFPRRSNCQLSDMDDSISDISIPGSQPNFTAQAPPDDLKSVESNSIIEFLDSVRERTAKGNTLQRTQDSPLRFSRQKDPDAFSIQVKRKGLCSEEPNHSTIQSRQADESDIGILQQEVVDLRSILEKYETDRLAKSFVHESPATGLLANSMLGDLQSSRLVESLRKTVSPRPFDRRARSCQPTSEPKERRLSISVLSGINYDPVATENVISQALDNMDSGSFTDSLTREHTSVSASALKSKIEHLKERMQHVKKPPRVITTITETPELESEGTEMPAKAITKEATSSITALANQPVQSVLEDFIALDRYKQASYEKTLTNMEAYLITVELRMKSLVKLAKHIFVQPETIASDGDSITSSYDVETAQSHLADGNLEGDVMHHIEKLHNLMKRAENKLLPAVFSSNSQSKLSDHSSGTDPHANFEHSQVQARTYQSSNEANMNGISEIVAPLPRAPSARVLSPTEDSRSEETSDGIVPSFEAFSDTHSLIASQHSDHPSLTHQTEALLNDLKDKASLIDKLSDELAEREAFIVQLSNTDNTICLKLEEKIKTLSEDLQQQLEKNKELETQLAKSNDLGASLVKLEYMQLAYEYIFHLLVSDPVVSFKASLAFNSAVILDASSLSAELTKLLTSRNLPKMSECSPVLQASLEPLLDLLPSVTDKSVQDTPFSCEIISQELENDAIEPASLSVVGYGHRSPDSHLITESFIKQANADYFHLNHDNNTPLMNAVLAENITAVSGLLHYARQINNKGETALMLAIPTRNEEIIHMLIGLEAGHVCSNGDSALLRCLRLGEFKFAELLTDDEGVHITSTSSQCVEEESRPPEILNAASDGDIVKVWSLLPCQKRMTDATGRTSLMLAADAGNISLVRLLCTHESQMRDTSGRTALMIAAANNQVDAVLCLIPSEAGMQSNDGKTALMYAAAHNSLDCLKALAPYESGRKATKEDGSGLGYTALMVAANKGHLDAIRLLLPYEQDLCDRKGRSAADYARSEATKKEFTRSS
ncbi:Protein 21.1 [Giardia lamblia P15]|uniref:Protein 21.1 n=1 Tax=Giardia intestinalis (strain P15) TaxID=658858 RepID=E1EZ36_GIAIA|nr:Protein 21.1 [Giardia lamblia P15]